MTFKGAWFGCLFLSVFSGLVLAEPDLCKFIDQGAKATQTKVIDGKLTIVITPGALQKRRPNEIDPKAAKKQLILAFNDFYQKKMNWNYLQIEAHGEQFSIVKCSNLDNYVFEIPLENVKTIKIDKPKEGSVESELINDFSSDEFSQDNSFDGFK